MAWSDLVKGETGATGAAGSGVGDEDTVQTTDDTVTTINTIATTTDKVTHIVADVIGMKNDQSAGLGIRIIATYRNDSGALTELDAKYDYRIRPAGWNATVVISGANVLLKVLGAAGTTVDWKSNTWTLEV